VVRKRAECNDILDNERVSFDNDTLVCDVQATEVTDTHAHDAVTYI